MKKVSKILFGFLYFLISADLQAQTNMDEYVSDVKHVRVADRTYIFSRAQFIYSLGAGDYLHRWVDRPLFINTDLDKNKPSSALMSLQSYIEMQKMALKYGLDGFAFFPQTSKRSVIYNYTKQSSLPGFKLLTEFTGDVKSKSEIIQIAKSNPAAFKINGRIVITSYNVDEQDLTKWQPQLNVLYKQFPNQFYFLPSLIKFGGKPLSYWQTRYYQNKITGEDINSIKDYLRKWARATDGLYFSDAAGVKTADREFDANFYQNFIIRIMKSVLAEPEFKNKLFGLSAIVGHENVTRIGYGLNSAGTQTLRSSMEAALAANPDIINIPEWDEQNENTSLRPTVMNGLTSLRLMRYYTSINKGQQLSPLSNDDKSVPNLTISYRKIVELGEKLQIELVDIPDNPIATSYNAQVVLKDLNGNIIYNSPEILFSNTKISGQTLSLPSEDYSKYQVLIPSVKITRNNSTKTIENGLDFIELRPTSNWNYKWVKQDVRDILPINNINFNLSNRDFQLGSTITADASISSSEPLAQVEILANDDVKYSYSHNDEWKENKNLMILSLTLQAMGSMQQGLKLSGSISLENATGKWLKLKNINYAPKINGQTLSFTNARTSIWKQRILIAIPKDQINFAILNIQMPGIFTGKIAVKDIFNQWIYGIPGPKGFNLVISRYINQLKIPENINEKNANFSALLAPDNSNAIYQLRAIGISGKIYRSKPIINDNDKESLKNFTVYSDSKNNPVIVPVNDNTLPDIEYRFNSEYGSVLTTNAGRNFWAIMGGYFAQATERGGANAGDDIAFLSGKGYPVNTTKTAPDWVKLPDNSYALNFDGKGTFVSIPQGVIPLRAGYTIEMDINPENQNGKQIILANRSLYSGSLTISMENGLLKASFSGNKKSFSNLNTNFIIPAGQWSHLHIQYDQQNLVITVNQQKSKTFSVTGPGIYGTVTVLGGYGNQWFNGKIRNLIIKQGNS